MIILYYLFLFGIVLSLIGFYEWKLMTIKPNVIYKYVEDNHDSIFKQMFEEKPLYT